MIRQKRKSPSAGGTCRHTFHASRPVHSRLWSWSGSSIPGMPHRAGEVPATSTVTSSACRQQPGQLLLACSPVEHGASVMHPCHIPSELMTAASSNCVHDQGYIRAAPCCSSAMACATSSRNFQTIKSYSKSGANRTQTSRMHKPAPLQPRRMAQACMLLPIFKPSAHVPMCSRQSGGGLGRSIWADMCCGMRAG